MWIRGMLEFAREIVSPFKVMKVVMGTISHTASLVMMVR